MSERDDNVEQAFHHAPSPAVLAAAKAAGLKRGDSFSYDNSASAPGAPTEEGVYLDGVDRVWRLGDDGLWVCLDSDYPEIDWASFRRLIPELPLNPMQLQVEEFHTAMGQPVHSIARPLPADRVAVRVELIREEFIDELIPALEAADMVESADAAIDLLYVTFGLLVEMGINAGPLFDEVHRSNMSKLGEDGKPIIAGADDPDGTFEGRVKKGPNYFRPNLRAILESGEADQGW